LKEKDLTEVFPNKDDHTGYQAKCSEHSSPWVGTCRSNNYEAFEDAKAHDKSVHGGTNSATISRSNCSP
jgi:hypothetical protein